MATVRFVFDTPDMQLDAADCAAIKAGIERTGSGILVEGPNIQLNAADLLALDTSIDACTPTKIDSPNLQLTAAEVSLLIPHIT